MWAYRRSALHNKAVEESLPPPEPINLRYRALIQASVKELVEANTSRPLVAPAIAWLLGKHIASDERNELVGVIHEALNTLHEDSIDEFGISLGDYIQWKSAW